MADGTLGKSVLVAAALAIGSWAQTSMELSVSPNPAPADKPFTLTLLGAGYNACYNSVSRESVTVSGTRIDLRYTVENYSILDQGSGIAQPSDIVCPLAAEAGPASAAIVMPTLNPVFSMPALKSGRYEVWATNVPACVYSGCKIALMPVSAGTLIVVEAPRPDWRLKDKAVLAEKPFQMQLLKDSLGTCTYFSHQSATVSGNGIYASFLMTVGKCAGISPTPIGPVFSMPAQKIGAYPIYPIELLPCEVAEPYCAVDRIGPFASDTLVVMQTLSIRMSAWRASGPRVEIRGSAASFALPEGKAGIWKAELSTLDGRLLAEKVLRGSAGERVSVPVGRAPAGSVSVLRLIAPDGAVTSLPIIP